MGGNDNGHGGNVSMHALRRNDGGWIWNLWLTTNA
jgi:hypothetical protein